MCFMCQHVCLTLCVCTDLTGAHGSQERASDHLDWSCNGVSHPRGALN